MIRPKGQRTDSRTTTPGKPEDFDFRLWRNTSGQFDNWFNDHLELSSSRSSLSSPIRRVEYEEALKLCSPMKLSELAIHNGINAAILNLVVKCIPAVEQMVDGGVLEVYHGEFRLDHSEGFTKTWTECAVHKGSFLLTTSYHRPRHSELTCADRSVHQNTNNLRCYEVCTTGVAPLPHVSLQNHEELSDRSSISVSKNGRPN